MKFYGPAAFSGVIARHDVGVGDRLYDHPDAYRLPWEEARKVVSKSIIVVSATKGSTGQVTYRIEDIAGDGSVRETGTETVSQTEFGKLVQVIEG